MEQWVGLGELGREIDRAMARALAAAVGARDTNTVKDDFASMVDQAEALGIDPNAFADGVVEDIKDVLGHTQPDKGALALVQSGRDEIERELAGEAPSIERAEILLQVLAATSDLSGSAVEAYADPAVDLSNAQRKALADSWREQWIDGRDERRATRDREAFWTSADFQDHYDDIAYYRVYERYAFGEFDELFDDVARGLGESLVDGQFPVVAHRALAVAERLWLVSRSHRLRLTLHPVASGAVAALFEGQNPSGFWLAPVAGKGGVQPPSVEATAMAVIAGRRLSRDEQHSAQSKVAIDWLIGIQATEGFWSDCSAQPDVLASALALDAIAHSGRPGTKTVCERAATWLIEQQRAWGGWQGHLPEILLWVTVLDAIRSVDAAGIELPQSLIGGLALVRRGELLARERSADGRQLAVVAAYTGLEAVLYALLAHPTINETTVRANGRGIGLNDALATFEQALVDLAHLQARRHVAGRDVLRRLTHVRDGVVHRGTQPTEADTSQILTEVTLFCRRYVPLLFGVDRMAD